MASCRAKPRWRRDYDPDALFRAKVPGGAFMPESTFVEDVEGAVTGTPGEYYSQCDFDPIGAWFYDAGAPQQHCRWRKRHRPPGAASSSPPA